MIKYYSSTKKNVLNFAIIFLMLSYLVGSYYLSTFTIRHYCLYRNPDGSGRTHRGIVSRLKSIAYCQSLFKKHNILDLNSDGIGEYATMIELSGKNLNQIPKSKIPIMEVLKSYGQSWRYVKNDVYDLGLGYYSRLYLSHKHRSNWIVFAWPKKYGNLSYCALLINQNGEIYCCKNNKYKFSGLKADLALDKIIGKKNLPEINTHTFLKKLSKLEKWVLLEKMKEDELK